MPCTHDQIAELVIKKTEHLLHQKVISIERLTKGSVNQTYKVSTELGQYVFRIFASKTWPETGKVRFIKSKLMEMKIHSAELITINRNDTDFPNGYMVELFIDGQSADDPRTDMTGYYKRLAQVVSIIHKIPVVNYGYIGDGTAGHGTFEGFISDNFDRRIKMINEKTLLSVNEFIQVKEIVLRCISQCKMPPVLCHGDISPDNVVIMNNESRDLILIDWDNATSGIWVSDFSVMTYWMKRSLNEADYWYYRDIFLENYHTDYPASNLDALERACHLVQGINLISFYTDEELLRSTRRHIEEDLMWLERSEDQL